MSKPLANIEVKQGESSTPVKKMISLRWWRRTVQAVSLLLMGQWSFYGIFRCPFLIPYVGCQNCPIITCHGRIFGLFWGAWVAIPLSAILFGRVFCGWICPGGLLNQLMGKVALLRHRMHDSLHHIVSCFKYVGLAGVLYLFLVRGLQREIIPIRIGDFFNSVWLTFAHANGYWLVRTGLILVILSCGLLIANFWCRFVCPTGGLLGLFRHVSILRVFKTSQCNDCNKCLNVCEMGTRPAESNCTNCCDCLAICPQDAIKIGHRRKQVT